jgi:hypothetical protein
MSAKKELGLALLGMFSIVAAVFLVAVFFIW